MLDKPDFVGSYDVGEYVYFFFREMSVEFMNCGKTVYSRVARVCKRDTGGKNILNQVKKVYLNTLINMMRTFKLKHKNCLLPILKERKLYDFVVCVSVKLQILTL
jgi:hypothetical protein